MSAPSDDFLERAGESAGFIRAYIKQQKDLLRLEVAEKTSIITSTLVVGIIMLGLISLVLVLGTITAGYYLGALLDDTGLAFLLLTGAFLLIALLIYALRRPLIVNPVLKLILQTFEEDSPED